MNDEPLQKGDTMQRSTLAPPTPPVTRAWVDTRVSRIHYAEAGRGSPVLFLHQTPRSWLEYAAVLPLAGRWCRAIAMDSIGFGDSDRPVDAELSIDFLASGVVAFMDALGLSRASLVGHHTGGIVALDVAATYSDRVDRLVLSSTPLIDAAWRQRIGSEPRIDVAEPSIDGSHLMSLWHGRRPFYPEDRIDLLEGFLVDALRSKWPPSEGHRAVQAFHMEEKLGQVRAPVVLIGSTADPFVVDDVPRLAAVLHAQVINVDGGMIPLPDQFPEKFERIVYSFLSTDLASDDAGERG